MNLSDSKKKLVLAGVVCGIVAACLATLGNPANMAFCIACFIRDTAGAMGMHQAEVVQFISHKNELHGLLDDSFNGIKVVFGEEGDRFVIGNSSMIVSKYQKGKQAVGSLGIIGPMRLDYAKIIPYIEYFTEKLSHLISEEDDEADNE